jgi:flagellar biosynthesis GTPase FlhF|tara:strand:- start:916 stop:1713 length:798 start_codon:yes stop_codon:yes gene_type:complete
MTKDYSLGKIYKIIDNTSNMFYVGSTCYPKLSQRLAKHRSHLRDYEKGYGTYLTSFEILNNDDYKIVLLENYPCDSIDELKSQEQVWIDKLKCDNMVNKYNAKGINIEKTAQRRKEYYENNKEQITEKVKEYREKNKEEIAQKHKEYREKNKEKIAQKDKEYREKNKEKIAQREKEYREKNKKEIAQKQKEYRETHKEELAQKHKEYYKTHKKERMEKRKEWRKNNKILCDRCNSIVNPDYFKKHRQSDKCINALPRGIINELAE